MVIAAVAAALVVATFFVVFLIPELFWGPEEVATPTPTAAPTPTTTRTMTAIPTPTRTTTATPTQTETTPSYSIHHEWSYRGKKWTYDAKIPVETYEYFRSKPRTSNYSEYVDNPADDVWIEKLARLFVEEAEEEGWGEFETVSFVLSFVQSWPYTSDDVTTGYDEYPRYPIETIVDRGGDCEDTSILFSSIVRGMGYGTVLLHLKEEHHMAVGVLISPEVVSNWNQRYPLTYYTSSGRIYAYCETTGEGWELGHKPESLKGTAYLIFV